MSLTGILLFGQVHLGLSYLDYGGCLALLSAYTGLTMACCVVVVRYRQELVGGGGGHCQGEAEKPPPSYCQAEERKEFRDFAVDPPPQYEDAVAMNQPSI